MKKESFSEEVKKTPRRSNRLKIARPDLLLGVKNEPVVGIHKGRISFKHGSKTRVIVNVDLGFGNQLFIRGQGAELSWDQGLMLKNEAADRWVWDSPSCDDIEFKLLINDQTWEYGNNHLQTAHTTATYEPQFF